MLNSKLSVVNSLNNYNNYNNVQSQQQLTNERNTVLLIGSSVNNGIKKINNDMMI